MPKAKKLVRIHRRLTNVKPDSVIHDFINDSQAPQSIDETRISQYVVKPYKQKTLTRKCRIRVKFALRLKKWIARKRIRLFVND